jgi:hypothetical protein
MTIVVYHKGSLAADRQSSCGGRKVATTKIVRLGGMLLGGSGDHSSMVDMTRWVECGADPAKFPASQLTDRWSRLLRVDRDGRLRVYEQGPVPLSFDTDTFATGSGGDLAIGAIAMGADIVQAVRVACKYDTGCGLGIDVLHSDGRPDERHEL